MAGPVEMDVSPIELKQLKLLSRDIQPFFFFFFKPFMRYL